MKDKANAVKENIKDMPTQTAYAVYSAKEKAKSSVSDFKRGMVQEQQSRQTGRLEKQEQHRQNIADKRMELQKAQEARQAQRKADGSATTGATRPHERPATASKPSAEKTQEVKRPATATTSKASEPVKTNVIKERPLSSGASDRKATQPTQTVHRQNVEKVVSQETRQNYIKDRRTKVQQTQSVQKNQQTTEKTRNLVTKKGQKKKLKLKHIALIGSLFPILFSLVLFFGVLISADSDDENSNFFFWHYGYELIRRSLETSAYGGKIRQRIRHFRVCQCATCYHSSRKWRYGRRCYAEFGKSWFTA